jgi:dephospho-CoA kinase
MGSLISKSQGSTIPFTVGLTGGIASGKSTVSGLFSELGIAVIDTDIIAREAVVPGQPALKKIIELFGTSFLHEDKTLNRRKLRTLVFSDTQKRSQLEAILHPIIRAMTLEQAQEVTSPYTLIVVPLMFETDFNVLTDRVISINVDKEQRLKRLIQRDLISETEAQNIIASQLNSKERNRLADDVIENTSNVDALETQVNDLHKKYLKLSKQPRR